MRNMDYTQLAAPLIIGIVLGTVFTGFIIPALRVLHSEQSIREDGPESHMIKAGTPTMGGIAIIVAVLFACASTVRLSAVPRLALFAFLAFGAIGFADDYIKVIRKHNLGLRAWQKLICQIAAAVFLAAYHVPRSAFGTLVYIPVLNEHWDFGIWYVPFVAFVIVAMVNSVNLTDGLDGLAAGVTAIAALFFAIVGMMLGLHGSGSFCAALSGVCLGFLFFNKNPAKVFMGDTGSLALGGGLAGIAVAMNMELLLPLVGFVYMAEALSVIIQVISFKTTGKRVFRMAPLHHHFELCGMSEKKVVGIFWIATALFCALAMFLM